MHQFLIFFFWYCKTIVNIFIELENIHGKMYIMWLCNSKKNSQGDPAMFYLIFNAVNGDSD